jgi:importin subunit beta-1
MRFAMRSYLAVFASAGSAGGVVQEETLLAVGALANAREADFARYMPNLAPFVWEALKNVSAPVVCNAAVGVVGDCCRALNEQFEPYMKPTMQLLIDALNVPDVDRDVTLSILSSFGDVAMACGKAFFELEPTVVDILRVASQTQVDQGSAEQVEYLHALHEAILDACVGVVNGFESAESAIDLPSVVEQFTQFMLLFALHVYRTRPPITSKRALIGLTFDIAKVLGEFDVTVRQFMRNDANVMEMLQTTVREENDENCRETARLALQVRAACVRVCVRACVRNADYLCRC